MKKPEYPIRTRLAKDIVAEIVFPKKQTGKIAILAGGLPSSPFKHDTLHFLAARGFVALSFRYRGTWESAGFFLEHSPARDIDDIINDLLKNKSICDVFNGEWIPLKVSSFYLFGASFGGAAVLLNSKNPHVKKVIALSPVIDWRSVEQGDEPFEQHVNFLQLGFPGAYRVKSQNDWKKIISHDFYNPSKNLARIDGKKVLILHAKDDTIVPYDPMISFAEKTGVSYYLKPKGGHSLHMRHLFLWKKINQFLNRR